MKDFSVDKFLEELAEKENQMTEEERMVKSILDAINEWLNKETETQDWIEENLRNK